MKSASDALFMRKLMQTVESTVSVWEQAIQVMEIYTIYILASFATLKR
jgi:hypothetical protein